MFYVCNKDKILSFIIAISTVTILFVIATIVIPKNETEQTSTKTVNENISNNIVSNNTIENNVINNVLVVK